jgi:hypothetical protein
MAPSGGISLEEIQASRYPLRRPQRSCLLSWRRLRNIREASQASRERWQCCGLLEALDGSRGYKVSGKMQEVGRR